MPQVKVYNQHGENVGSMALNDELWGLEPNKSVMYDAVILALANRRQDTSKTKKRDEVSGGGKKPYRQKGTGRARQGSTRAPQWRHGGIVFGPDGNQNHKIKMNKRERVLALKSALAQKWLDYDVKVVDKFVFDHIKTKDMVESLKALDASDKALIVLGYNDYDQNGDNLMYSACNIQSLYGILYFDELNVYDILNSKKLVITQDAIKAIEGHLLGVEELEEVNG